MRSPLAKLTRPKLHDVLSRPRLFALLDEARTRPIVWVCAPPGAGKTTLIASYLEARSLRHLWYQYDLGDADTATFVHYMRIAAQQLGGKAADTLPQFGAEPQQDLARFARSFFRDVFSALPRPCAVVFDNFHEPRTRPEQRAAFVQGLDEVPEGITVIVLSRADPPEEFARLVASRRIARIEEADLRCTPDESQAILGDAHLAALQLQRFQEQSDGWVAALVLLREHLSRRGATPEESLGEGKDAIFQYFAGEIFSGARPENQRVLMLTAMVPSITASEAVALTGIEEAPRLLEYLYRRHLFTDRRNSEPRTYHYHALFREFLVKELAKRVGSEERRTVARRAAELLAERGQVADALSLFRDAGEWEAMRALIRAHALEWARQGRGKSLSDWIEALPADLRASDPWLEYWYGRAWIFVQPERGRPPVERAHAGFHAAADRRGEALAISAMVTSYYYEWANFAPLDRWLPEFEGLLGGERASELDRESELRARAAWLIALLFRRPDDDNLARCAQRLDQLIDGEPDLNLRVMAASFLLNYINWTLEGESAGGLVARIEPILERPEVTPLMQLWWRTHLSFWHYLHGRHAEAAAVIAAARALAERYGLQAYLFEIDYGEAIPIVTTGDRSAAKARMDAIERSLPSTRRGDWAYFHHLRSVLNQRLEQFGAALDDAERALALARETGLPAAQIPHFLLRVAYCRMVAGDNEAGMRVLEEALSLSSGAERRTFEQLREVLQIDLDLAAGPTAGTAERLAAVLAEYRAQGNLMFLRHLPDAAARLADYALAHGIETEFVRTMIERNALVAPADAGPSWPFRLRIRVLNGFELVRDGAVMRSTGKAQQRPLDVLKLLVALGGREVDSEQMTAALWPDGDGASAKSAFDTALYRLRKLIDVDNALVLTGGKLSLDRTKVWTDVWALEAALDAAERSRRGEPAKAGLARSAHRLLTIYPGPLLGTEEAPWIVKPRDALRARVVRALVQLGDALERQRDWPTAADVYRRGLEADNLGESLYRGLMRSLAEQGDRAEALNAFRRCRELLSIVLGIKPSAETERLQREIASGDRPPQLS
jgi:ATP/maltotriose-dependent transcriptional regulator MalT/DNA-binding SARP family transcriptional activator